MKRMLWTVLATVGFMTACGDPVPPTTPTPAVPRITETFTDTLRVSGTNTHLFSVDGIGGLQVTLNSVEPSAAVLFGVGYPSLGSCTLVARSVAAPGGNVLLSG